MPMIKRFLEPDEEATFELPEPLPKAKIDMEPPFILVSRKAWGAQTPMTESAMHMPIRKVRFTYEDLYKYDYYLTRALRKCQDYYMKEKGMPDIPYNFLVGEGGLIFEGRGWSSSPESVGKQGTCLDIAFIADCSGEFAPPSFDQCDVALSFLKWGIREEIVHPAYEAIPIVPTPAIKKSKTMK